MCIDFDGHHSGGSSFDSVIRCGPYPQVPVGFKKKKKIRLRVPVLSLAPRTWFGSANRVGPGFGT